jgi:hypothetical protein
MDQMTPPSVKVDNANDDAPLKILDPSQVKMLGQKLDALFMQYVSDRRIQELRWLRNQRQYLGLYDPEIEKELNPNRSKAYPRVTRVKCISVLSRIMNLMFPGNERNWQIEASPNSDMTVDDVKKAIALAQQKDTADGGQPPELTLDYVMAAVQSLADSWADQLSTLIDDQLEELGGDQTLDYVSLNHKVIQSGVNYGLGVLRGPFVRAVNSDSWSMDPATQQPTPKTTTVYKPMFEFLPVWDFYPDMSAKNFRGMDGYFTRVVMSRSQVRKLADRVDFFHDQIIKYLNANSMGNYRAQPYETELRAMGTKINVNEMKTETSKYEVIVWHGPVSGDFMMAAGIDIDEDKRADEIDAEVWLLAGHVIKCVVNPWVQLGVEVKTVHTFIFDEDDTAPIGQGLPNIMRDSQMSIAAATRMLLDNASVTCGPQLELNTDLLRADQDLTSTGAYKIWYREGSGQDSQFPAVRNVQIDAHLEDLMKVIDLFMKFADTETFVGPATGGDMAQAPSEPMRTAAGASMLRGDAALPFKDIIRRFDCFTQSVIDAMVQFNHKFNNDQVPGNNFNVIARGATSLVAKEVRGMQIDNLAQTLKPEEMIHVDERKMVEARFKVRDLEDMLLPLDEVARRQATQDQQAAQDKQTQQQMVEAQLRKLLSEAYKNITAGQQHAATADAASASTALTLLEQGLTPDGAGQQTGGTGGGAEGAPAQQG